MLVLLDRVSYIPTACSKVFNFFDYGVEFCLSMDVYDNNYVFWISRQDRNPTYISVPCDVMDFQYKFDTSPV